MGDLTGSTIPVRISVKSAGGQTETSGGFSDGFAHARGAAYGMV